MKKPPEYFRHAVECRGLAATIKAEEQRLMLLKMAETWEGLAHNREKRIAQERRLDELFSSPVCTLS
jgi:hypothetical protein